MRLIISLAFDLSFLSDSWTKFLILVRKVDAIFAEYDKTNTLGCALAIVKDGKNNLRKRL